jgi:predicted ester cyclase
MCQCSVLLSAAIVVLLGSAMFMTRPPVAAQETSPAAGTPCPATTEDENEALVRRYIEEAWNQGNLDVLDEVMAATLRIDRPGPGGDLSRDDYKARIAEFRAAFPDFTYTIEASVTEGDLVVVRFTYSGTLQGELDGVAPTGQRVTWNGLEMVRIVCGQFVAQWIQADALGLRRQLGIITEEELASVATPVATQVP